VIQSQEWERSGSKGQVSASNLKGISSFENLDDRRGENRAWKITKENIKI
jgi:hypothetical protein